MIVHTVHKAQGGGGITLHVEEYGNRAGRPILFIHGFSQCRLAWQKQVSSDLANDFRLVAMDIRGHGLSDRPQNVYGDSRLWADDVHSVITTLALNRPILSGWSYGGLIICDYLRSYGEAQIGGIQLVGAATKIGTEDAMKVIGPDFLALVPGFFATDVEASMASLGPFVRLCVHKEPTVEDFYFMLGYNTIVPPHVRQGLFSRQLENDDIVRRITTPVLITHGERDAIVLVEAAYQHKNAIRQAQLSVYPEVGHAPFWEDAKRFNAELRKFAGPSL
jgi:pimeloyl-ACP methyl ester carboxylesterase